MNLSSSLAPTAHAQRSRAALLAWTLCAICWVLLLGTVLLMVVSVVTRANGGPLLPAYIALVSGPNPPLLDLIETTFYYGTTVAFATLGALIVARYPQHAIGWIFCALSVFGIGEQFAKYYAVYRLLAHPGALPFSLGAAWITEWTWTIFYGLLSVFCPCCFQRGIFLPHAGGSCFGSPSPRTFC